MGRISTERANRIYYEAKQLKASMTEEDKAKRKEAQRHAPSESSNRSTKTTSSASTSSPKANAKYVPMDTADNQYAQALAAFNPGGTFVPRAAQEEIASRKAANRSRYMDALDTSTRAGVAAAGSNTTRSVMDTSETQAIKNEIAGKMAAREKDRTNAGEHFRSVRGNDDYRDRVLGFDNGALPYGRTDTARLRYALDEDYRGQIDTFNQRQGLLENPYDKLKYLTDEERRDLQYYASRGEYDRANEYLDYLAPDLNARMQGIASNEMAKLSEEQPVAGVLANIAASREAGLGVLPTIRGAVKEQMGIYEPVDTNSRGFRAAHMLRDTTEGVGNAAYNAAGGGIAGDTARFLAEAGLSAAQNASMLPMGGTAPLVFMGSMAAGQSALDTLESGGTAQDALKVAVATGIIETATEKIGIDNFFRISRLGKKGIQQLLKEYKLGKPLVNNIKSFAGDLGTQMAAEGAEEMIAEVAENLADTAIRGDNGQYAQLVQNYMANGMSEEQAKARAFTDMYIDNVLKAGAQGALAGGMLGVGGATIGTRYNNEVTAVGAELAELNITPQQLITAVQQSGSKDAQDFARELSRKLVLGQEVTLADMGQLHLQSNNYITSKDYEAVQKAAIAEEEAARNAGGNVRESESAAEAQQNESLQKPQNQPVGTQTATNAQTGTIDVASKATNNTESIESTAGQAQRSRVEVEPDAVRAKLTDAEMAEIERTGATPTIVEEDGKRVRVAWRGENGTIAQHWFTRAEAFYKMANRITQGEASFYLSIHDILTRISQNEKKALEQTETTPVIAELHGEPGRGTAIVKWRDKNGNAVAQASFTQYELSIRPEWAKENFEWAEEDGSVGLPKEKPSSQAQPSAAQTATGNTVANTETNEANTGERSETAAQTKTVAETSWENIQKIVQTKAKGGLSQKDEYTMNSAGRRAFDRIGRALGVEIHFVDRIVNEEGEANGLYQNGHIFIARNAENPYHVVLAHEITHHFEKTAPDVYEKFKGAALEMNPGLIEKYMAMWGYDEATAEFEVTADFAGQLLEKESTVKRIIKEDISAARGFHRAMNAVFDKVRGDDTKGLTEEERKLDAQLDAARDMWRRCLRETRDEKKEGGNISAEALEFSDSKTQFSLRKTAPPKKTGKAYKVFVAKNGQLYPPKVANPGGEGTPVGVWLDADVGESAPPSKTGRAQVKSGGKGTDGGSGSLAFRPGWHMGDIPHAKQFARTNPETGKKELFPANFVWAECEYAADVDYQDEAMSYGYTENGKFRHSYAGLPKVPTDGYYRYRTNPDPDTVPWIISGAMKVTRILTDEETDAICRENGVEPMKRQGGALTAEDMEQKFGIKAGDTSETRGEKAEGGESRAQFSRKLPTAQSIEDEINTSDIHRTSRDNNKNNQQIRAYLNEHYPDLSVSFFNDKTTGHVEVKSVRTKAEVEAERAERDRKDAERRKRREAEERFFKRVSTPSGRANLMQSIENHLKRDGFDDAVVRRSRSSVRTMSFYIDAAGKTIKVSDHNTARQANSLTQFVNLGGKANIAEVYAEIKKLLQEEEADEATEPQFSRKLSPEQRKLDEGIRFSMKKPVEYTKNLVALHNLSSDKFGKTLDLGGFPMPSIAVTKDTIPHTNFGEISLVMPRETIDPKANKRNTVYSADAWTPIFPQIEYEANEKKAAELRRKYYDLEKRFGREAVDALYPWGNYADDHLNRVGGEAAAIERYRDDTDMMKVFLADTKGKVPEPVTKETKTRLSDDQIKMYDHIIGELGRGAVYAIKSGDFENPLQRRRKWFEKYGDRMKAAYKSYLTGLGFSDEEADNAVSQETRGSLTRHVLAAQRYMENGPETKKTETDYEATREAIRKATNKKAYETWLKDMFGGIEKASGLYNYKERYTPSGNLRSFAATHYPVTLENIVKAMRSENGGNTKNVTGFRGVKTLRAGTAVRFKSVEHMHELERRLQHLTDEEAEQISDALEERLIGVIRDIYNTRADKSGTDNYFIIADEIGETLEEIAESGKYTLTDIRKTFEKYRYPITTEIAQDVKALLFDISEMPVNIFEAKPERVVGFDEVLAAVVPSDIDAALKRRIEDAGMRTIEYEAGSDESRLAAVNSVEGAKFSRKGQTLSPEFKRWFGDWENDPENASKVVNKDGTPKVVYHGTQEEFNIFDGGAFFTDDYFNADGYASGERVVEAYIQIKNPLIIDAKGAKWDELDTEYGRSTREIVYSLDEKYDGVIFESIADSWADDADVGEYTVYYVRKPEQIKSATDNIGTFDRSNPDIRYSRKGQDAAMRRANRLARENARLKGQFKLTKGVKLRESDIRKVTRELLKEYEIIDYDKEQFERYIKMMAEEAAQADESNADATWDSIRNVARGLSREVGRAAFARYADVDEEYDADLVRETYEDIRRHLGRQRVLNPWFKDPWVENESPQRKEMRDYYRRKLFGVLTLTSDRSVDKGPLGDIGKLYEELTETFGEAYFPSDVTNDEDQIMHIADVLDDLKDTLTQIGERTPVTVAEDVEQSSRDETRRAAYEDEVYGEFYAALEKDILLRITEVRAEKPTLADKEKAKRGALKNEVKKLREERNTLQPALTKKTREAGQLRRENALLKEELSPGRQLRWDNADLKRLAQDVIDDYEAMDGDGVITDMILELGNRWQNRTPADAYDAVDEAASEIAAAVAERMPIKASKSMREDIAADFIVRLLYETQRRVTLADKNNRLKNRIRGLKEEIQQNRTEAQEALREAKAQKREALQELKDKYKAKTAEARERQNARELRRKIERHTGELYKKLSKPTNEKHINEDVRPAAALLISLINQESSFETDPATGKRVSRGGTTRKAQLAGVGLDIDLPNILTKRTEAARKMKKAAEQIFAGEDNYLLIYDPELMENLAIMEDWSDKPLTTMSSAELQVVWDAVRGVEHMITQSRKVFNEGRQWEIGTLASGLVRDVDLTNPRRTIKYGAAASVDKLLNIDQLTPQAFFHRFGEGGDRLFRMLRRSQDKYVRIIADIQARTAEVIKDIDIDKLNKDIATYKVKGGDVTLSRAQVLLLYASIKREQAAGHILGGGIKAKPLKGKGLYETKQLLPVEVTQEDLDNMFKEAKLTEAEKKAADGLVNIMSTVLAEYGNEASLRTYGYAKFREGWYVPIETDPTSNKTDNNDPLFKQFTAAASIAGRGFAKQTKEGAKNAIMVGSLFDVYAKHVNDMAMYAAYVETLENMRRVRNFKFKDGTKTQNYIEALLTKSGVAYWDKLIRDINGGERLNNDDFSFDRFVGAYKAAAVSANIRVILQQPTAIIRAAAEINPAYLIAAMRKIPKRHEWERIKNNVGIAQWKDWGYFDINTGRQMRDVVLGTDSLFEKFKQAGMRPMSGADSFAWTLLYHACEDEAKAKGLRPGSAAFDSFVASRFSDIIDKTQVVDGVLQRSQIMRSTNAVTKMATSFMAEPTKTYNMFLSAVWDFRHARSKTEKQAAKKKLGFTVAALVVSFLTNAAAQSLIDALRDDDRDKEFLDKFWDAYLGRPEEDDKNKAVTVMGGNLWTAFNPVTYIPFFKDIVSLVQGFDTKRMDMESIGRVIDAAEQALAAARGEGKQTAFARALALASEVSRVFGLPLANIKRDSVAVLNTIAQEKKDYGMMYNVDRAFYKLDKNVSRYVDIMLKAHDSGDTETEKRITDDLHAAGVDDKKIKDAADKIRQKQQNVDSVTEIKDRYRTYSEAASYNKLESYAKGTSAYRQANATERSKYEKMLEDALTNNDTAQDRHEKAQEIGVSDNQYMEFLIAQDVANRQRNDGTGDNEGKPGGVSKEDYITALDMTSMTRTQKSAAFDKKFKKGNPYN